MRFILHMYVFMHLLMYIATWLLRECASVLIPTITNIVNLSLISGNFYPTFKESVVSPIAQQTNLG